MGVGCCYLRAMVKKFICGSVCRKPRHLPRTGSERCGDYHVESNTVGIGLRFSFRSLYADHTMRKEAQAQRAEQTPEEYPELRSAYPVIMMTLPDNTGEENERHLDGEVFFYYLAAHIGN